MPVALGTALCSALTGRVRGRWEGFPRLGNCSWTPMPQGGHSHCGIRSGSVTSEVMKSHEPVGGGGWGEGVERAFGSRWSLHASSTI